MKQQIHEGAVTTIETQEKELTIFTTSDVHFDSIYCNRSMFFKDMDYAKSINAGVYIFGDFYDALNGRFDPRRDMEKVRPEYRKDNYYDLLVNDAAKQLDKYKDIIKMIAPGNHELSVLKFSNTYLTDRLVAALNKNGGNVIHGHYGGWIRFAMRGGKDKGAMVTNAKYFHGSGGEAPVTRGAIQTSRQAVFLPDANIVYNGHNHSSYHIPIARERMSSKGRHYFDLQHHVRTPGYCQAYGDGTTGWEVTRGGVPKPLGGCVTILRYDNHNKTKADNTIEIIPRIHAPDPVNALNDLYDGIVFPQE